ncbi:MAG: M15 family metallopeptidase [Eubacteriales bacterium]
MPNNRTRRNRHIGLIIFVTVISIALVITTIFSVSYMLDKIAANTPPEKGGIAQTSGSETAEQQTEPVTEPVTEPAAVYNYLEYTEADVHAGNLILVNAENEYVFPEKPDLVSIYGNKPETYKISSSEILLERNTLLALNEMTDEFYNKYKLGDVLVSIGYRDYDTQMKLYSDRVEAAGLEAVSGYIALAGFSEHHTALAFDLSVYTDDGVSMTLADKPQYSWLANNCYKYGFVLRYDPEKTDITGIQGEKWHFRYVGQPHSYYMKKNNLVLEEYIDLLRGYTFESEHLIINDDIGRSYEIYTVPLTNSEIIKIPVPQDTEYNVSGNNKNGFIVTLKIS